MPVFGAGQPIVVGRRRFGSLAAFGAASGGGFDPATAATGLLADWDADTLAGADGSSVTTWTEPIGSRSVTQATAGLRPTLMHNAFGTHQAVSFDGTQWLGSTAFGVPLGPPSTLYLIAAVDATPVDRMIFDYNNSGTREWVRFTGGNIGLLSGPSVARPTGYALFTFRGAAGGVARLLTSAGNVTQGEAGSTPWPANRLAAPASFGGYGSLAMGTDQAHAASASCRIVRALFYSAHSVETIMDMERRIAAAYAPLVAS